MAGFWRSVGGGGAGERQRARSSDQPPARAKLLHLCVEEAWKRKSDTDRLWWLGTTSGSRRAARHARPSAEFPSNGRHSSRRGAAEPSSKRRRVLTGAVGGPAAGSRLRRCARACSTGRRRRADDRRGRAVRPRAVLACRRPFPASLFARARALAKPFNTLVDRVSRDTEWLHDTVRGVVEHDEFTGRLLALSEAVVDEGATQPLQLGIYRSDYMVHQPGEEDAPRLLQVELNTISVSFVSLAAKMTRCHRHALTRAGLAGEKAERAALRRVPAPRRGARRRRSPPPEHRRDGGRRRPRRRPR